MQRRSLLACCPTSLSREIRAARMFAAPIVAFSENLSCHWGDYSTRTRSPLRHDIRLDDICFVPPALHTIVRLLSAIPGLVQSLCKLQLEI